MPLTSHCVLDTSLTVFLQKVLLSSFPYFLLQSLNFTFYPTSSTLNCTDLSNYFPNSAVIHFDILKPCSRSDSQRRLGNWYWCTNVLLLIWHESSPQRKCSMFYKMFTKLGVAVTWKFAVLVEQGTDWFRCCCISVVSHWWCKCMLIICNKSTYWPTIGQMGNIPIAPAVEKQYSDAFRCVHILYLLRMLIPV